jgi:hypothetical protein
VIQPVESLCFSVLVLDLTSTHSSMNNRIENASFIIVNNLEYIYYKSHSSWPHKYRVQDKAETIEVKEFHRCHRRTRWVETRDLSTMPYSLSENLQHETLQPRIVNTFGIVLANVTVWWIYKWRLTTTCIFG